MSYTNEIVIAFDLYGTLVTPQRARERLVELFGQENAEQVATLWRRYQLEYTWRLNSMGIYRSFDDVAKGALKHALAELGLTLSSLSWDDGDGLMDAFITQQAFPDVPPALETIKENPDVTSYIFSNGSSTLVEKAVKGDPELSRFEGLWNGVYITASEGSAFKPSRQLYDELVNKVVVGGGPEDVWLVTANPFDVVGARAAGLNVAWVDRESKGWVDRLGTVIGKIEPTIIVKGVDEAVKEIIARASSSK
ncbi:hypothetical protein DL546_005335 [Coniochaeta pulveracea]|uniref:Haloacid dehalogenase, type II n=1 Tax=Coniochaeta pulveracea TaxID=177199 RepID=A0A420Y9Q2_9PEZI|nr:hypothetical protein DL546_005335 [Coniochaeta pulveracea]